jgi:hypothetical protein
LQSDQIICFYATTTIVTLQSFTSSFSAKDRKNLGGKKDNRAIYRGGPIQVELARPALEDFWNDSCRLPSLILLLLRNGINHY